MTNYLILITSVLLAVTGQLLMKQGMNQFGAFSITQILWKIIPMFFNPFVLLGFCAFAVSSIFWLVVLSRVQLSLAYPMVSMAYVLVAFASILIFKESISLMRWAGIAIICFGVFLISRS